MRQLALLLVLAACTRHHPAGSAGAGGSGPPVEICDNGVDDDGDGSADCADPSCRLDPHCPVCGDGFLDVRESCEGGELRGASCTSLGFDGGNLRCGATCAYDTSECLRHERCDVPGDEDGNGLADCADPVCAGETTCFKLSVSSSPGAADVSSTFEVVLRVQDPAGRPRAGATVVVDAPEASWASAPFVTGPEGLAPFTVRLGRLPGDVTFNAHVAGGAALPVTIRAREAGAGTVLTVVNATRSSGQDGAGPAIAAAIGTPVDVQAAPDGTLYVAEPCRILSVSPAGVLDVVAGDGSCSGAGAGITVAGLALDPTGATLYFSDPGAGLVRSLSLGDRTLRTLAGGGEDRLAPGSLGLGGGALYASDSLGNRIVRIALDSGVLTTAVASVEDPSAPCGGNVVYAGLRDCVTESCRVAVDGGGTVFVGGRSCPTQGGADPSNALPMVLRLGTGTPAPVTGTLGFESSLAFALQLPETPPLAFDPAGNLHLLSGERLLRIDGATTAVTPLSISDAPGFAGDGGPVLAAQFDHPSAMAFGPGGDLYMADSGNGAIRRVVGLGSSTPTPLTLAATFGDDQTAPPAHAFPTRVDFTVSDGSGKHIPSDVTLIATDPGASVIGDGRTTDLNNVAHRNVWSGIVPGTEVFQAWARGIDGRPHGTPAVFHMEVSEPDPGTLVPFIGSMTSAPLQTGVVVPGPTATVWPSQVAAAADGSLYLSLQCQLAQLGADGGLRLVAGDGTCAPSADGSVEMATVDPGALAFDDLAQALYFADAHARVRALDLVAGTITTVTGAGASAPAPGVRAADAGLQPTISALALDGNGKLYVGVSTVSGGLYRIDLATGVFDDFLAASPCPGDRPLLGIRTLAAGAGEVWVGTDGCEGYFEGRLLADGTLERVAAEFPRAMTVDADGALVWTSGSVAFRWDPTLGTTEPFGWPGFATGLTRTAAGRLAFATGSSLLVLW